MVFIIKEPKGVLIEPDPYFFTMLKKSGSGTSFKMQVLG